MASALRRFSVFALSLAFAAAPSIDAQQNDPLTGLTPAQKEAFAAAAKPFAAQHFAEALTQLKPLLAAAPEGSPAQILIAKYTAEAEIDTGDRDDAVALLKPIQAAFPNDWQARSLLARAYAEAGDKTQRDAELAAVVALHKANPDTPVGKATQILLEHDALTNGGSVSIWYSLEPWGRYKTYVYSRVFDKDGNQTLRVTLESSDFDQPMWAKNHADLAAKGERMFSMDGYGPDQKLPNGQITQSHMTFGFFDGQPPYDTTRERILKIAEGKQGPMSRMDSGSPAGAPASDPHE
jgi:Tetratricopeptide repeat